jgi:hypothetical protein
MATTLEQRALELFFPAGVFEWFELTDSQKDDTTMKITLQEKNIPPLTEEDKDKKVEAKGFNDITITDFPIRGRQTLITFKRRYWQIEGRAGYLKRDIKLNFPGTKLEKEFADFLKEGGGK